MNSSSRTSLRRELKSVALQAVLHLSNSVLFSLANIRTIRVLCHHSEKFNMRLVLWFSGWRLHILFCVLEKMNFGSRFMAMIKTLYQYSKAAILTNSDISSQFPLTRETQQACPLSPLLFALVIEPLAIAIRSNSQIHGVLVGNVITIYADDIMLSQRYLSLHWLIYWRPMVLFQVIR